MLKQLNILMKKFLNNIIRYFVLDYHSITFAVKSKYTNELVWSSINKRASWSKIVKESFEILKYAEPATFRVDGKSLKELKFVIPISPSYGTHIIDPANPSYFRESGLLYKGE